MSEQEYAEFKSQFYVKPGIPEIELELQEYQKRLLIDQDLTILKTIKERVSIYARSLLLKFLTDGDTYIDPNEVSEMAEEAALNFIRRFFRNDEPAIGASFAGILKFKVREVLSNYYKQRSLESAVSLDENLSDNDEKGFSLEQILTYEEYEREQAESRSDTELEVNYALEKIDKVCKQLKNVHRVMLPNNLDTLFLKYLLNMIILQHTSDNDIKTQLCSKQALRLLGYTEDSPVYAVLETAYMDTVS